jgi:hypothetical protein
MRDVVTSKRDIEEAGSDAASLRCAAQQPASENQSRAHLPAGRILDERFLSVHPRTALWWTQRGTCQRCAHCVTVPMRKSVATREGGVNIGGGMNCAAVDYGGFHRRAACIDARDRGECGPEAKLFKEAV